MVSDYDYEMAQAAHNMQARLETDIATLVDQRNEARALARHFYHRVGMLEDAGAALAADAVDAIKGRQEAERELREARERNEALVACVAQMRDRLSPDGEYRIVRKDGKNHGAADWYPWGELFVEIDALLEKDAPA